MKNCFKCKNFKSELEFSKDKTTSDGYNAKCKQCVKIYSIDYEAENSEKISNRKRSYYLKNKEVINKRNTAWKRKNPDYSNNYRNMKRLEDPIFKLKDSLRQRLNKALKKNYKTGSAVSDLGCSVVFLKNHLESKFQPGMTWINHGLGYGKWNIDHILPLSSFDLSDEKQLKKACNYKNLQPLWFEDNLSKGDKV